MNALIAWPDGAAHRRLRAALMWLRVVPESLAWPAVLARVRAAPAAERDRLVALVDLSDASRPGVHGGAGSVRASDLPRLLPNLEHRAGVWLSRTEGAALSDAERQWALDLGFGGWIADTSHAAQGSELEQALQALSVRWGLAPIERGSLARADALVPTGDGHERLRSHIRAITGLSAEAWGRELPQQLPVADRRWRLRTYPACVVGAEVVGLWAQRHGLARGEAVVLGRAAVALGLMRHVAGEHDFEDGELFYELLDPSAITEPGLGRVLDHLRGPRGPEVADRSFHGKTYRSCWIGSEAVDSVVKSFGLPRATARLALQRLMQLGHLEHVVREQPLRDGHFFYRHSQELTP